MVDSQTRLRGSAAVSMGTHGALLGAYLLLRTATATSQPALTRIELMDLRPAPVEAPATEPAQRLPRHIKDFLRLALPQFRPSVASQEPLEAPREKAQALQDVRVAPSLKIDSRSLGRAPSVRLDGPRLERAASSSLSDVSADAGARRPTDLTPADVRPDIELDAVGRRAVRGPAAPSIRIDPNARVTRTGGLGEVASLPPAPRGTAPGAVGGERGIKLVDGAGPRGAGRLPPPVIGYGRGSGGGLSLRERPLERPRAAKMPEEDPAAQPRAEKLLAAKSNKAVELSGPLAKRKILSMPLPEYPSWAKERGVEAEVSIRFFVSTEGRVRDRTLIERTSGYEEIDRACVEALKKWSFIALEQGAEGGDQWGIVTFRFRLK